MPLRSESRPAALSVDIELLGHFDDRVPRRPVAAAEPAETGTNLVLATMR
jgi:hypothetical protein